MERAMRLVQMSKKEANGTMVSLLNGIDIIIGFVLVFINELANI